MQPDHQVTGSTKELPEEEEEVAAENPDDARAVRVIVIVMIVMINHDLSRICLLTKTFVLSLECWCWTAIPLRMQPTISADISVQ